MEQWNQVEELFLAAAELAEPARSVFLERHASPELRREVAGSVPGVSRARWDMGAWGQFSWQTGLMSNIRKL